MLCQRGRLQLSHASPVPGYKWKAQHHQQQPSRGTAVKSSSSFSDAELLSMPLEDLMHQAASKRDRAFNAITFSPKVFIPLTRLCRDTCGYCTFALPPTPGRRAYMTLEEVLQVARLGEEQGCTEALLTLGDKPELRWPEAAAELQSLGYSSTLEYVEAAARAVLEHTGLMPHINAGVMSQEWLARLKRVSASQGLMLEGVAPALMQPGGAHEGCPDKEPATRLEVLNAAGAAQVPFTTGILIGIGENRPERLAALRLIQQAHSQWGHVQEVICQNFRAKQGTAMQSSQEPPTSELLWTVAVARLILDPDISIQAPPNLTRELDDAAPEQAGGQQGRQAAWQALIQAGINDWGGISPLTRDHVNPESPWPHLKDLAAATAAAGWHLLPRLPVYPPYIGLHGADLQQQAAPHQAPQLPIEWLDGSGGSSSVRAAVLRAADSCGLARGSEWCPGLISTEPQGAAQAQTQGPPPPHLNDLSASSASVQPSPAASHLNSAPSARVRRKADTWRVQRDATGALHGVARPVPSPRIMALLDRVLQAAHGDTDASYGQPLTHQEVCDLLSCRGADAEAVCHAADTLRRHACGDQVTYVVNRNINYTNVCTLKCGFCAFSKGKVSEALRGPAYLVPLEEISRRAAEAWDRGATEVCMQGGIHPDFTGRHYLDILRAAKQGAPDIHVHAFSPLEVHQGAASLGLSLQTYLSQLKDAGLGSLPGTAAEVLCDQVRAQLCPDKISSARWLEVVSAAHEVGLNTTSTLMFGHLEMGPPAWARHLIAIRDLQARTGGITEFVPLPFVHMEAPLYLKGAARRGPTLHECILLHAVARLALYPHITNIQASWVKMGPEQAAALLSAGCNDMGGSLMNESITRAAGAAHGQELPPRQMEALIRQAGRTPRQRSTLYKAPVAEQVARSLSQQAEVPLQPLQFARSTAAR